MTAAAGAAAYQIVARRRLARAIRQTGAAMAYDFAAVIHAADMREVLTDPDPRRAAERLRAADARLERAARLRASST